MKLLSRFVLAVVACVGSATASAQTPAPGDVPGDLQSDARREDTAKIADEGAPSFDAVQAVIAAEAQRLYGGECGEVRVPKRAIETIELTGGGPPEYAVFFSRVECEADGGTTTRWQGTGGGMIQFWLASGGPPRLLLEHNLRGFSPTDDEAGLITHQHGAFCPESAGPNVCEVLYRWNDRDRALEVAQRTPLEDGDDIDRLSRALRYGDQEIMSR